MYAIPLALIVILGLIAVAWTPIFALIVAVPLFLGFLVYVGMKPRADETVSPPGATKPSHEDSTHGIWGEK